MPTDPSSSKTPKSPAQAAVLSKALLRAADRLQVTNRQLGRIVGVSESTISRLGRSAVIDPRSKEGELAVLFVRLFRSLDAMLGGNPEACQSWFHAHNHHLAGSPVELVQGVQGLVHVIEYLDAMRSKV